MLTTLIASRHPRTVGVPAQVLSVALHTALIAAAVLATQRAATVIEPIVAQTVTYVKPAAPVTTTTPAPPILDARRFKGFRVLTAPVVIPDVLPDIDLSRPLTNADDYLVARGVPGGDPDGVESGSPVPDFTEAQVDRAALLLPGSGRPVYPEALRGAGLGGTVDAQFVIDSTGRADMRTVTIVASTHPRFTDAVMAALAKARFSPAEFGGRKVRQVVRMPFVFSLRK